ncbi:hypothetical protein [Nocardia altamirensis]|uniref:hypothetical protein n=1 Tax=Nocardia altamirensis TaxID=472158 RepID=UPI0008408E42|nr:hypothetical protein [Nocardia altamirensis]
MTWTSYELPARYLRAGMTTAAAEILTVHTVAGALILATLCTRRPDDPFLDAEFRCSPHTQCWPADQHVELSVWPWTEVDASNHEHARAVQINTITGNPHPDPGNPGEHTDSELTDFTVDAVALVRLHVRAANETQAMAILASTGEALEPSTGPVSLSPTTTLAEVSYRHLLSIRRE